MPFPAPRKLKGSKEFNEVEYAKLRQYIIDNVKSIDSKLSDFRTSKLPEMVRIYKGKPKSEDVEFPWPGAANLIVQLVGTFCDELLSRVMAIFMYDPLWKVNLSGASSDQDSEDQRRALEQFLMDEAYDPTSLNYYQTAQAFFNSAIKYGTGILEFPWETIIEERYQHTGGGTSDEAEVQYSFEEFVSHDGPSPRLVPINKFGIDPNIPTLDDAKFFYTIQTLLYWEVKDLKDKALYKDVTEEQWDKILNSPSRQEPDEMQREMFQTIGVDSGDNEKGGREYDFYNCYIRYTIDGKKYSLMCKYFKKEEILLFGVFNFYPKNAFPVEDAKLAYDNEGYFGTGYATMLRAYQRELSQNSNWRTNNRNFAMMGIFRVDPGSKLSSILQMYPGVMVPAKDGEIERISAGADVGYSNEPDSFIMALAKERAGVDPAIGGTGGGLVNNKRGIYSASGTSMVLIQQNNRNNLRMSDMRSAHVRIAIKIMDMFAYFGIGARLKRYGDAGAEILRRALDAYKQEILGFRLRPTTASNNKELDRQNDILLAGTLERFYTQAAQMLQALGNPAIWQQQPALAQWYVDTLTASVALYRTIAVNFNHSDMNKLVPNINKKLLQAPAQPGQSGPPQGGSSGPNQGSNPGAGQAQGAIPFGAVSGSGQVPI